MKCLLLVFSSLLLQGVLGESDCSAISGYQCSSDPCTCEEVTNCQVCNNGAGCGQCESGYFKFDTNYQCTQCQEYFGVSCLFCQDYNGCAQCADGYSLINDPLCGINYCGTIPDIGDSDDDGSVASQLLTQFINGLANMINTYNMDDSYYYSFIDYASEFNKLDYYPVDGSDNYLELKLRYETFISNDVAVNGYNADLTDYLETSDEDGSLAAELESIGWTAGEAFFEHSMFSDMTDSELTSTLSSDTNEYSEEEDVINFDTTTATPRRRLFNFVSDGGSLTFASGFTDLASYDIGIQDEGNCPSSFAFASTGQFEINYNIYQGNTGDCLVKFSEQYAMDCGFVGLNSCNIGNNDGTIGTILAGTLYENVGHCTESEYGAYTEQAQACGGCNDENFNVRSSETNIIFPWDDYEAAAKIVSQNTAMHFTMNIRKPWFFLRRTRPYYFGLFGRVIGSKTLTIVGQWNFQFWFFNFLRLKVKGSWGTNWAGNGYAWITERALDRNNARFFTWSEFAPGVTNDIPSPLCPFNIDSGVCLARCKDDPCSREDNPNCAIRHSNGCEKCESGYFQKDLHYPCLQCQEVFGDKCTSCNNWFGCAQCDGEYKLEYDAECGLFKCVAECKRVRKPWHLLDSRERSLYIQGFLQLQTDQIPVLANIHQVAFGSAHGNSGFLPWHRYFLWELESQIRDLGGRYACFGLPYWDWGHDTITGLLTNVYSTGLSGPGDSSDGNCVTGNFFDFPDYAVSGSCLERNSNPGNTPIGTYASPELLQLIVEEPEYGLSGSNGAFRQRLEFQFHNPIHCIVGGHMCTAIASSDPLFYLHHNYIDFLWAVWQDCHDHDTKLPNILDFFPNIYDATNSNEELDDVMNFGSLSSQTWSYFNSFNPTPRMMHNINDPWDVCFDKGDFWEDAKVLDDILGCQNDMNDAWFVETTGSADRRRRRNLRRRRMQDTSDDGVCSINFQECSGTPCNCDEFANTCKVCNNGQGCAQCEDGYFKLDSNHNCIQCQHTLGEGCMFCQDGNGCGQCAEGYVKVHSEACGIYVCESTTSPAPTSEMDPFAFIDSEFEAIKGLSLTLEEKREVFTTAVCEFRRELAIERGDLEDCQVPSNFEDCSDMELNENGDIDITLNQLLSKQGVAQSPCLQKIRTTMYDWAANSNGLLGLCNGAYDPKC